MLSLRLILYSIYLARPRRLTLSISFYKGSTEGSDVSVFNFPPSSSSLPSSPPLLPSFLPSFLPFSDCARQELCPWDTAQDQVCGFAFRVLKQENVVTVKWLKTETLKYPGIRWQLLQQIHEWETNSASHLQSKQSLFSRPFYLLSSSLFLFLFLVERLHNLADRLKYSALSR